MTIGNGIARRGVLGLLGGGLAAPTLVHAEPLRLYEGPANFLHGVASGDPGNNDIILWTRITPEGDAAGAHLAVDLEIAEDAAFTRIIRRWPALLASAERDFTIKHLADGLKPATDYYYRFRRGASVSPVGRTRTLPEGSPRDLVLAFASCALWPGGFFNAYEAIARTERLDAVVHLGDYIYEYGGGPRDYGMQIGPGIGRRPDPPHLISTLDDYRRRHAQYKADPQLQAAHARAPWIVVWDDHEVANNSWHGGGDLAASTTQTDWRARKAAALRAYYEWMPIREPLAHDDLRLACRSFRFGDLAELVMVETRLLGRDEALEYETHLEWEGDKPLVQPFLETLNDPDRQMLGPWQEQWLNGTLAQSVSDGVRWQLLGNQVVMARVAAPDIKAMMEASEWQALLERSGSSRARVERNDVLSAYDIPSNLDSWDGYPAARSRVYDMIRSAGAHAIALAGDTHMFWANELWDDSRQHRIAAEFATTSITSPSYGDAMPGAPIGPAFAARNPEVVFNDADAKGFLLLHLTREAVRADFMAVSSVREREYTTSLLKRFKVDWRRDGVGPTVTL